MDNKILHSPGSHDIDSSAATSRKRKSRSPDIPEAASGFHLPRELSLKQDSSFHGTRERGNTTLYETVMSESPTFDCRDGFSDTSFNGNFPGSENRSMTHLPSTLPAQASLPEWERPPIKVPSGETTEVPNCTDQECHSYTQSEANKGLSFAESSNVDNRKPQFGPVLEDGGSLTKNEDISEANKGLSFAESSIVDTGKPQLGSVWEDVGSLTKNEDTSEANKELPFAESSIVHTVKPQLGPVLEDVGSLTKNEDMSEANKGLPFAESSILDTGEPQLSPVLEDVGSLINNEDISEANKGLSFPESSIVDTGKPQFGPVLEDVGSLTKNEDISIKLPLEMCSSSSKFLIPEFSQPKFSESNTSADFSERSSGGVDKLKNSCETKDHDQPSGHAGISNQPFGQDCMAPSAYPEEKGKERSTQHEVQHSLGISADNIFQRGGHGRSNYKLNESETVDDQNQHQSLRAKVSIPGSIIASCDRHACTSGVSQKVDENRLPCPESASMGSEKLWDGSIQINSSITISAVAFFKSGERMVDINWSKFLEVKGKVRLDAFEKYILDLPLSRTRGWMVISLCAKEGSSDEELKRMKVVAKAYRNGERVALAEFSEGVNLYLCPQSDKVLTILAKGRFFKGTTAFEGESDSFIGCVVWRKNSTAVGSVANEKNSNKSIAEQPQKSPSDFSKTQQSGESSMSPLQPIKNSLSLVAVNPLSAVESINVVDRKAVISNSSGANLSTAPVLARSSVAVLQQGSRHLNLASQTSRGLPLGRQASSAGFSEPDKSKASLELPKMSISLTANVKKQMLPMVDDDDDLPEFDFETLRGIVSAGKPIDVPIASTRLQTERIKKVDGAVLPGMPVTQSVSASNSRIDNLSNPRLSSKLPTSAANHGHQSHVSGRLEDQHRLEKYATAAAVSTTSYAFPQCGSGNISKRNLFPHHDYDMPEWFPPQHQMPPLVEGHKSSAVMPSQSSASLFQNQQVLGWQVLHPPSPLAVHPEFSSHGFPRPHLPPPYFRLPPPMLSQSGPSFWAGFQRHRALRPPSGPFVGNHIVRPADERYWWP